MNTIRVRNQKGHVRQLDLDRIKYLSGLENYSLIHIVDESPVLVSLTLKVMAEQLPGFLRIHKQTLVNPHHITSYQLVNIRDLVVKLSDECLLTVSRRRVRLILGRLNQQK